MTMIDQSDEARFYALQAAEVNARTAFEKNLVKGLDAFIDATNRRLADLKHEQEALKANIDASHKATEANIDASHKILFDRMEGVYDAIYDCKNYIIEEIQNYSQRR